MRSAATAEVKRRPVSLALHRDESLSASSVGEGGTKWRRRQRQRESVIGDIAALRAIHAVSDSTHANATSIVM
jgi:hypothetical protein